MYARTRRGRLRRNLFVLLLMIGVVVAWYGTESAYNRGVGSAVIVALFISWIPMQLIAIGVERRTMLLPGQQFKSFYWGDLICLPGVAACSAVAVNSPNAGADWWCGTTWTIVCIVQVVIFAFVFRINDRPGRSQYDRRQFNSPTKLWHDYMAYPAFGFYLLKPLPALFYLDWGESQWLLIAMVLFGVWVYMGVVIDARNYQPKAHVSFDWDTLTVYPSRVARS